LSSSHNAATQLISELENLNRETMKTVLTYAEMSLPLSQFKAFRKVILDLYGKGGLRGRISEVVSKHLGGGLTTAGGLGEQGQSDGKGVVDMR